MSAPMMRSRQQGHPCTVSGHGSRCEVSDERRPETRARERRQWTDEQWQDRMDRLMELRSEAAQEART